MKRIEVILRSQITFYEITAMILVDVLFMLLSVFNFSCELVFVESEVVATISYLKLLDHVILEDAQLLADVAGVFLGALEEAGHGGFHGFVFVFWWILLILGLSFGFVFFLAVMSVSSNWLPPAVMTLICISLENATVLASIANLVIGLEHIAGSHSIYAELAVFNWQHDMQIFVENEYFVQFGHLL